MRFKGKRRTWWAVNSYHFRRGKPFLEEVSRPHGVLRDARFRWVSAKVTRGLPSPTQRGCQAARALSPRRAAPAAPAQRRLPPHPAGLWVHPHRTPERKRTEQSVERQDASEQKWHRRTPAAFSRTWSRREGGRNRLCLWRDRDADRVRRALRAGV